MTDNNFLPIPPEVEKTGKAILDSAFKVHSALGPGLLEVVYETALIYEMRKQNLSVKNQSLIPIEYDGQPLNAGLRCDMVVENAVIIELKAVEKMIPLYEAQLLTYLKLSGIRLGYLINFNVPHLKNGIKRIVR